MQRADRPARETRIAPGERLRVADAFAPPIDATAQAVHGDVMRWIARVEFLRRHRKPRDALRVDFDAAAEFAVERKIAEPVRREHASCVTRRREWKDDARIADRQRAQRRDIGRVERAARLEFERGRVAPGEAIDLPDTIGAARGAQIRFDRLVGQLRTQYADVEPAAGEPDSRIDGGRGIARVEIERAIRVDAGRRERTVARGEVEHAHVVAQAQAVLRVETRVGVDVAVAQVAAAPIRGNDRLDPCRRKLARARRNDACAERDFDARAAVVLAQRDRNRLARDACGERRFARIAGSNRAFAHLRVAVTAQFAAPFDTAIERCVRRAQVRGFDAQRTSAVDEIRFHVYA
jgi:hypothetical protein